MPDYTRFSVTELEKELKRAKDLLEDTRDERAFLGKQTSMHINASEFGRLDREIEKFEARIHELESLLANPAKASAG